MPPFVFHLRIADDADAALNAVVGHRCEEFLFGWVLILSSVLRIFPKSSKDLYNCPGPTHTHPHPPNGEGKKVTKVFCGVLRRRNKFNRQPSPCNAGGTVGWGAGLWCR